MGLDESQGQRLILRIDNEALDYAWGSKTLISDYFGTPATGHPMAEIWYGTHPSHPSRLPDEPNQNLLEKIGHPLSFLLKILAADRPLSIQAHPSERQAQKGFARENARGIEADSPLRNYKDDRHKPEMIVALVDGFEALAGFRPQLEIRAILAAIEACGGDLGSYAALWKTQLFELGEVFEQMMTLGYKSKSLVRELASVTTDNPAIQDALDVALTIAEEYPDDPGVLVTLLMNHVTLAQGEALAVPAGQVHAYIRGIGVEVMASSDNVLRGGLTKKHIDLVELQSVLVFDSIEVEKLLPKSLARGLSLYPSICDDFLLYRVDLDGSTVLADLNLPGDGILLCTAGQLVISNSLGEAMTLRRGEAAYISGDAKLFTLSSSGNGFFVTTPR